MKLKIDIENCYGIGSLRHEFNFGNSKREKSVVVYAPNGTMKTSFAQTFADIAKNDKTIKPKDRAYPNRISKYNITIDDVAIDPSQIFTINAEDSTYDSSDKVTSFLASKDLKSSYDKILKELDDAKKNFITKLKGISGSTNCEEELIETFKNDDIENIFDVLVSIESEVIKDYPLYNFQYNHIFDPNEKVKEFLQKNQAKLSNYVQQYNNVLSKSTFFSKSDNEKVPSFGTYQSSKLTSSVNDNAFFRAGHKVQLKNDKIIEDNVSLEQEAATEIERILNNTELKKIFEDIDKALSKNNELRAFKDVLEKNKVILSKLSDYEIFKKEIWYAYVFHCKDFYLNIVELYKAKKQEIADIIAHAQQEQSKWQEIVNLFNDRFSVPFTVEIINQKEVILNEKTAKLIFKYADESLDATPIHKERPELLKILSKGEQRAFFILQMLFELEARRSNTMTLLILDDISDSFDYRNKYAIVEYLQEISESGNFYSILLTHNFDFYRTVISRLRLLRDEGCFMVLRRANRTMEIVKGQYANDALMTLLKNVDNKKFISLIPFARNLIEYTCGLNDPKYIQLTSCLHLKQRTNAITVNDVAQIFKVVFTSYNDDLSARYGDRFLDFIFATANTIISEQNINEIILENKIALSVAIRLKAEQFMLSFLTTPVEINEIENSHNQTAVLYEKTSQHITANKLRIIRKVLLMTPANIHVNSFMYEPIIDIAIGDIVSLYEEVKTL